MTYLLIHDTGRLQRTCSLLSRHFVRADAGALRIVNMETEEIYTTGAWRSVPARPCEPAVLYILDAEDQE